MRSTDMGALRKYCKENEGGIFDTGYLTKNNFKFINKDSFRKFVSRLVDEEVLTPISKGIYYIGNTRDCDLNEAVIKHYASYHEGMIGGLSLLYEFKLIRKKPEITVIYSNLTSGNKNIGNCSVKVMYSFLSPMTKMFFQTLNLIYFYDSVDADEGVNFVEILNKHLKAYDNFNIQFIDMRDKEKFPRFIYLELAKLLEKFHISNKVMEWYEAKDSSSFEKN